MRLLDAFCGAGGAAVGYHRAGFDEIVGVDIKPQPRYPFTFVQGDAIEYIKAHGHEFDAIHASPPCQAYTRLRFLPWLRDRRYWDSIPPTRDALIHFPLWVMENVEDAKLDAINLCGRMFGLEWQDGTPLYRHRLFESSLLLLQPPHIKHSGVIVPGGLLKNRGRINNGYVIGGHQNGLRAMGAMRIDWMTGEELSQAIPPAYTEFIGRQLIQAIR